jgi:transketolase
MSIYPLEDKFRSFNFEVVTIDGHDYEQIQRALDKIFENPGKQIASLLLLCAHTRMGKGVSFMDDRFEWHGIPPNLEQAESALNELSTK